MLEESQKLSKDECNAPPLTTEEEPVMEGINTAEAAVSGSIPASQEPDHGAEASEDIIPADPDSVPRPNEDNNIAREQERGETLVEEIRPSVFVSNQHLTGSGENLESLAEDCVAHGDGPGTVAPVVTAGVAEDQLLEDYVGSSSEPQAREPANEENKEEPSQNLAGPETDTRDSAMEKKTNADDDEPTTKSVEPSIGTAAAAEGSNRQCTPENAIQEKTRDDCLPATASPQVAPVSVMSSSPADGAQRERSGGAGDMGSADDRDVDEKGAEQPPAARNQVSQAESGASEQEERGQDTAPPPPPPSDCPPKKVGLMDKIKGEIKVMAAELQKNKEKVGKKMKGL
jgi:hypothetical protein